MRKKSESRRIKILKTATKLFLKKGYEKTSMDELTNKLGYSKATIYNYFPSKKDLFIQAIHEVTIINAKKIFTILAKLRSQPEEFWLTLHAVGRSYLHLQLSNEVMGLTRIVIAEGQNLKLKELTEEFGPSKGWQEVANCFEEAMKNNILRTVDPMLASMHFKGLLESEVIDQRMKNIISSVSDEKIEEVINAAVDVFKRAYQA